MIICEWGGIIFTTIISTRSLIIYKGFFVRAWSGVPFKAIVQATWISWILSKNSLFIGPLRPGNKKVWECHSSETKDSLTRLLWPGTSWRERFCGPVQLHDAVSKLLRWPVGRIESCICQFTSRFAKGCILICLVINQLPWKVCPSSTGCTLANFLHYLSQLVCAHSDVPSLQRKSLILRSGL